MTVLLEAAMRAARDGFTERERDAPARIRRMRDDEDVPATAGLNREVENEVHRAVRKAAEEIIEDLAKPKSPEDLLGNVTSLIGG